MKKILAMILALSVLVLSGAAFAETLTMATNVGFPPYEYYDDETGEPTGIDIMIATAIAEKLGYELEVIDMDFSAVIAAVATGKYDMALGAITVTEERKQSVDFSDTYATGIQSVVVPVETEITSVDDLFNGGYAIGVQEGTTGDIYASGDFEETGLCTIERYKNLADAIVALTSGKIDCIIVDNGPAVAYTESNEALTILDAPYTLEEYAIVLPKGSELMEPVNTALQELIADGTVQSIIETFIPVE